MATTVNDKPVLLIKKLSGVATLVLGILFTATGLVGGYRGLTAIGALLLVTGAVVLVLKIIRRNPDSASRARETTMTSYDSKHAAPLTGFSANPPPWARAVLGVALILAGLVVLSDVVLATIISAKFIGIVAVAGGAIEIVHAFWIRGWGGFAWHIVLGVIYVCFGVMLFGQPVAGALLITWVLGLLLLISGVVRTFIGYSRWQDAGWVMLLSGIFGILAGLVVLTGFPMTGLWVLGFVLGIDLLSHGIAWLTYVWLPGRRAA